MVLVSGSHTTSIGIPIVGDHLKVCFSFFLVVMIRSTYSVLLMNLPFLSSFSCLPVHATLLLLACSTFHGVAAQLGNQTDHQALLAFKSKITGDQLGVLDSWNDTLHFCQWHGVTCESQRVTILMLNSSRLVGSLTPYLGNLSLMRVLNLENNSFGQQIPPEIGNLGRLEQLRLANNSIVGAIPSNISACSNLKLLDLIRNLLVGELPDQLGRLSKLQEIRLSTNKLTGKIPSSFGNLSSLQIIRLARNGLTGSIPESIGDLKSLLLFSVSNNGLSGLVPSSVFNISSMRTLDVAENVELVGRLPVDLGTTMPEIEQLFISGNRFTGPFPVSLSNATQLARLSAANNSFTGSLPSFQKLQRLTFLGFSFNQLGNRQREDLSFLCTLVNATDLQLVALNNNKFGGEIPECVVNLSARVSAIALEHNMLSGKIPTRIGNLISLERLSLQENQLSGDIPSSIGTLQNLKTLDLSMNSLSGTIPSSFGGLKMLTWLALNDNKLEGKTPPSLGNCTSLIFLSLASNKLSGSIPAEIFSLSSLAIGLDLSSNQLTGSVPQEVGDLKGLGALDLSNNMLSGEIPSSIANCESLEVLNFSRNMFQGSIPSSLGSLSAIQVLNLSNNRLTGEIPGTLAGLRLLNSLNLSNNDCQGMVPSDGVFLNGSIVSVKGNHKLCGGTLDLQLPKCGNRSTSSRKRIVIIIVCLLSGTTILLSAVLCYLYRRKRKESVSDQVEDDYSGISYNALLKATDGFSTSNLIGAGGFGSVYRGTLNEGKTLIAVKVFNLLQQGASKSFMAECKALENIRHRNLLKIFTVCSSVDHQGNDFKALVYELMSNGSLEEWLHQKDDVNRIPLSLFQRVCIGVDVACALDYLHNHLVTPIVHCDLKPSNVLLDDDMVAHLGDFGLVKFLPRNMIRQPQHDTSSIALRGSIGYTAPEYGMGSEVSTSGDVYSYGVLLLEMFTAKRPTNELFQAGLNLHRFAKEALEKGMLEIIDPTLLQEDQEPHISDDCIKWSDEKSHITEECLIAIMRIGVACSAEHPRERMRITDVVSELSLIKDELTVVRGFKIQNPKTLQFTEDSC